MCRPSSRFVTVRQSTRGVYIAHVRVERAVLLSLCCLPLLFPLLLAPRLCCLTLAMTRRSQSPSVARCSSTVSEQQQSNKGKERFV